MTEPHLYDFSSMPLTNEQKILATLERIEERLFAYINSLPKPPPLSPSGAVPLVKGKAK